MLTIWALAPPDSTAAAGDYVATQERRDDGVHVHVLRRRQLGGVLGGADPSGAVVCTLAQDVHRIRLVLDEPLGAAAVIDDSTGVQLAPVVDAEVLRPVALPAGWSLLGERPLREGDRQTGWVQRYGTSEDEPSLSVVQRLASLGPNERFAVDRVDVTPVEVRGVGGTWSRQADGSGTSLVWQEAGWEVALSSTSPDGVRPPLDRPVAEAFAATLAPAG